MADSRKYLDPQTLAKLSGLSLKARMIVEGSVAGMHKSPYHGFSVEFAQHREYAPGDDLRYVDWKAFGRSDRFYLKQYEEETNFACHIIVDRSESMQYCSAGAPYSKLEFAKLVASAIAYLIIRQQDAIALATFDSELTNSLPPSNQPAHFEQFCHILEQTAGEGETSLGRILRDLADQLRKRAVVLLLSDFLGDEQEMHAGLKYLRYRKHDVSVLHIADPAEQEFPFDEPTRFHGLEGLDDQIVEPQALREAYRAEFENFSRRLRQLCHDVNIDYRFLRTDDPIDVAVTSFLTYRDRRTSHAH